VASNGANSIIVTSNALYNSENDDVIRRRIKAIILTVVILSLLVFMFLIPIFGQYIIDIIGNLFNDNIHRNLNIIYHILQIPLSLLIIYFDIKLIYTLAPDKDIRSNEVTSGAWFTTISWVVVTQIYSYYLTNFSNYSRVYGNLSNIIILMLYMYLLAYVFVIGMAFNASRAELDETIEKTGKIEILKSIHTR